MSCRVFFFRSLWLHLGFLKLDEAHTADCLGCWIVHFRPDFFLTGGNGMRRNGRRLLRRRLLGGLSMLSLAIGLMCACGSRSGDYHCGIPPISFSVDGHTYAPGGCAGQYARLGPVTVKAGSTFTAKVPKGYPLPGSTDPAIVRSVSRSDRAEKFRAVAPGSTTLDVLSAGCYRAPVVRSTRGVAPTPAKRGPVARCTVLSVRVIAGR